MIVYIYIYIYILLYQLNTFYMYVNDRVCVYVCACVHACLRAFVRIHMHVCMCVCAHTRACVRIRTARAHCAPHTHTCTLYIVHNIDIKKVFFISMIQIYYVLHTHIDSYQNIRL